MEESRVNEEENERTANGQQNEAGMTRAEFNAANEKLLEDQLQISEDKL